MACDRCINIHNAQACGCSNRPCQCDCHVSVASGTEYIPQYTTDCSAGGSDVTTTVTHYTDGTCSVINLN